MLRNKNGRIRSGWKVLAVLGTCLGLKMIIQMVITVPVQSNLIKSGDIILETTEFTERGKKVVGFYSIISLVIQNLIFLLLPLLTWKKVMGRPYRLMGLTSLKKDKSDLIKGIIFGGVAAAVVFLTLLFTKSITVESWQPSFSIGTLGWIGMYLLVGFSEEISMRGFIMSTLRQSKNIVYIICIPAFICGFLHSGTYGIGTMGYCNILLISILFGFMYYKSGNIWMCIGFHSTWYLFQSVIFGLSASGETGNGIISSVYQTDKYLSGGQSGVEGSLITMIVIILCIGIVFLYYKKKGSVDFMGLEPQPQNQESVSVVTSNFGKNVKAKKMSISKIAHKDLSHNKEK